MELRRDGELWRGEVDGRQWSALPCGDDMELTVGGHRLRLQAEQPEAAEADADAGQRVASPMPGTVVALPVAVNQRVEANQVLAIVEAMKMENRIYAPRAGVVSALHCQVGDIVAADQVLASIAADEA